MCGRVATRSGDAPYPPGDHYEDDVDGADIAVRVHQRRKSEILPRSCVPLDGSQGRHKLSRRTRVKRNWMGAHGWQRGHQRLVRRRNLGG